MERGEFSAIISSNSGWSLFRVPYPATLSPFPEDEEVGMILPGVYLTARLRLFLTPFSDEAELAIFVHDFYVGEPLTISANFVLALDDEYAPFA